MDSTVWAAIIGAVGTVSAAVATWGLTQKTTARNREYDKVTGSISTPSPNTSLPRTFECKGIVAGLQSNLSVWLAVESCGLVWPRENRIHVEKDNSWSHPVFEDGASKVVSLALYVGDGVVNKFIESWLEQGRRFGAYEELRGIPNARRIARIDNLIIQV